MDTVAHLHDAQQRADRAAAARKAAEHLRQVTARHCDPAHGWAADTRSPVDMVMADFPTQWAPETSGQHKTPASAPSPMHQPRSGRRTP